MKNRYDSKNKQANFKTRYVSDILSTPKKRKNIKIGRNVVCLCGSGIKNKKCCNT